MKRISVLLCVLAVGAVVGVTGARAAGTFDVTPSSVTAGADVTVSFCGFAAGDAGYYTVNGPSVSGTRFWGPANGVDCLTYVESTSGWAPGKYKFIAYMTTPRGRASRVTAVTVTVTAP
jgi:hypothetical protein